MKAVFRFIAGFFKRVDMVLLILVTACSALSVTLIYSIYINDVSSYVYPSTYKTQVIAMIAGTVVAIAISLFDYKKFIKIWYIYLPFAVFLVLLTFTPLGLQREGADDRAWINLGFTTLQPSEVLKLAFILSFAYHLQKVGKRLNEPKNVILLLLHAALPIGLIIVQGDDGTAIVFCVIALAMLFAAGISWKYIVSAFAALPLVGIVLWNFVLQQHQKNRILVTFSPELDPLGTGNQQRLGKIALGSGQVFGKGLFKGTYSYVPEVQNDFIFSYVGQTLGFVGCVALCIVITIICIRLVTNGNKSNDQQGNLICVGVFALIFVHAILNIGMVLGVMPVIGVPLPFISAGGTAMLSMYATIGLAMSVYSHSEKEYKIFKRNKF